MFYIFPLHYLLKVDIMFITVLSGEVAVPCTRNPL